MKRNKLLYILIITTCTLSCKKMLNIGNPNAPTVSGNITSEASLLALASGSTYINAFANGDGWLGDSYFSLPWGYNELMADNLGAEASNNQVTTIGVPDYIILDDGTKETNPSPQVGIIRAYNTRAATGASNNALYYQWLNMYALNNACNEVLSLISTIKFTGDSVTKINTLKAWCYWWKGYAYASIGSMYYSGLIIDEPNATNNKYVLHDAIIAESNKNLNTAATLLKSVPTADDYNLVLGMLIPAFCQVGHGGILTPTMWTRNINSMLARNILLSKLAPFVNNNLNASITKSSTTTMTTADWNSVLTYTKSGIQSGDYVFTGRTTETNNFFSASGGTAAALTVDANTSNTYKISERFMQNFKSGDKRVLDNFDTATVFTNDYTFATRWSLDDGGNGLSGVYVYATKAVGSLEVYIGPSYEENELMLAEANIRLGNTETGLSYIDAVRSYLGAGVASVAGTGLSQVAAMKELVMERRVALIYRGISFYDNRRWGWTYDVSKGGGSYGRYVYNSTTKHLYTNVTISYNFMDYWDVPADESELNPPADGGVAVVNPNY